MLFNTGRANITLLTYSTKNLQSSIGKGIFHINHSPPISFCLQYVNQILLYNRDEVWNQTSKIALYVCKRNIITIIIFLPFVPLSYLLSCKGGIKGAPSTFPLFIGLNSLHISTGKSSLKTIQKFT